MRVLAVIQARVSSTRLPGKVLRPLGGRPVLDWVVRAARCASAVDEIVIATSTDVSDDAIAALGDELGCPVVRGPLEDVLSRFLVALDAHPADGVVRLTADCPLVDPALIGQVVAAWRHDPTLDYVSTTLQRTLPRGLDVELVRADVLQELDRQALGHHRSHVTSLLYGEPAGRRLLGLVVAPPADDLRVTLDTALDAAALEALVGVLGDAPPSWSRVVEVLRTRPDILAINTGVEQKPVEAG